MNELYQQLDAVDTFIRQISERFEIIKKDYVKELIKQRAIRKNLIKKIHNQEQPSLFP